MLSKPNRNVSPHLKKSCSKLDDTHAVTKTIKIGFKKAKRVEESREWENVAVPKKKEYKNYIKSAQQTKINQLIFDTHKKKLSIHNLNTTVTSK